MRTFPLTLAIAIAAIAVGCGERQEPEPGAAPASAGNDESGFDIAGTWEGRLRQQWLKPFRVEATIESLDDSADSSVSYTGIDCGGRWTYTGMAGDAFVFRELIDSGEGGDCKGVGTVTLTPAPDGRLDYEFRGGGVTSRGLVSRVDG